MDTSKDIKVHIITHHHHRVKVDSTILDIITTLVAQEPRVTRTVQVAQEAPEVRTVPEVLAAQEAPMDQVVLAVREVPEAQEVQVALETQAIPTVLADRVTLVTLALRITFLNIIIHIIIHNNLFPTNPIQINYSSTLLCNSPILCVTQKIRP